jgi:hypothetical protein
MLLALNKPNTRSIKCIVRGHDRQVFRFLLIQDLSIHRRTSPLQSGIRRRSGEGSSNKPEHHSPRQNIFCPPRSGEKFRVLLPRRKWQSLAALSSPKRAGTEDRTHSRSARLAEGQLFPQLRTLFPLFVSFHDMYCVGKKAALKSSCSHERSILRVLELQSCLKRHGKDLRFFR